MLNNEWNMHIDGMNELWFISIQLELILYTWNVNSQVSESLTSGGVGVICPIYNEPMWPDVFCGFVKSWHPWGLF